MKKIIIPITILSIILSGCDSKSENKSQESSSVAQKTKEVAKTSTETVTQAVDKVKEAAKEVEKGSEEVVKDVAKSAEKVVKNAKEAVSDTATKVVATNDNSKGQAIYKPCISCHGKKAEKKALGRGQIIAGWSKQKTIDALEGYKSKTYGGPMKNMMYPQASKLTKEQIEQVAAYISTL